MKRFEFNRTFTFIILLSLVSLLFFEGCAAERRGAQPISLAGEARSAEGIQPVVSAADERRILQASSHRIAELVKKRPKVNPFFRPLTDHQKREIERINIEIAQIENQRNEALTKVVQAENPQAQMADASRGILRMPFADNQGRLQWLSGHCLPIWHLQQLNPWAFFFADALRSRPQKTALPANTHVTAHLFLAGSSSQRAVHLYPGDIDFSEAVIVQAPDETAAGEAIAEILVESLIRISTNTRLEFDVLRIMPMPRRRIRGADHTWPRARILDRSQRTELARQLTNTDGGRVNTDWRALIPGRGYFTIGKIFGIQAVNIKGDPLFATQPLSIEYQGAHFGNVFPSIIEDRTLGDYASEMRNSALRAIKKEDYLKAAKRSFNYFRTIGDLDAMAEVTPVFASPEARISQQIKNLEAIAMALDPASPSRILPVDRARDQLKEAAAIIEAQLPIVPGTISGRRQGVAYELRAIASDVQGRTADPVGILAPNAALAKRMNTLIEIEIKPLVNLSLKDRVAQIIDAHVR